MKLVGLSESDTWEFDCTLKYENDNGEWESLLATLREKKSSIYFKNAYWELTKGLHMWSKEKLFLEAKRYECLRTNFQISSFSRHFLIFTSAMSPSQFQMHETIYNLFLSIGRQNVSKTCTDFMQLSMYWWYYQQVNCKTASQMLNSDALDSIHWLIIKNIYIQTITEKCILTFWRLDSEVDFIIFKSKEIVRCSNKILFTNCRLPHKVREFFLF